MIQIKAEVLQDQQLLAKLARVQSEAQAALPVGSIILYAGNGFIEGFVPCDGRALSKLAPASARAGDFRNLFAQIGLTYTPADQQGGNDFNVPDLRGRTAIGFGQTDGIQAGPNRVLGQKVGAETQTMTIAQMPAHVHDVRDGGHSHNITDVAHSHNYTTMHTQNGTPSLCNPGGTYVDSASTATSAPSGSNIAITNSALASITVNTQGGGQAFDIMPPSLTLKYMIKWK
jgi:microcystin-dependent protein